MKLLLDEMYPQALADALRAKGVDASTAGQLGLAGRQDADLFAAAVTEGHALLTENVADLARLAAEHLTAGGHHRGILLALSSRFSRRPDGIPRIAAAVCAAIDEPLEDRLVYLVAPTV